MSVLLFLLDCFITGHHRGTTTVDCIKLKIVDFPFSQVQVDNLPLVNPIL